MKLVKPKFQKRKMLIAGVVITAIATIVSPAAAQISGRTTSLLSSIFGAVGVDIAPYLEYVQAAEDFYQAVATNNLSGILEGITVAAGELGIPIPSEVQKAIDRATARTPDQAGAFGVEAVLLNKVLQGQADYEITRSGAETILSADGQQRIAEIKEITAQVAGASSQASQTAQGSTISQDILKQIAIQNNGTTAILKSIYDSTVDGQIANAQTSQAIGNISKTLTEEAWEKRVTSQAGQIGLMDTTAQFSALVSPRNNQ